MKEITLREHLQKAGRARWQNKTEEEKKAHAVMMAQNRWKDKRNNCTQT